MTAIGRSVLNYFGSKVSTAHKYPQPKHDLIVEPFAGGAGYSLCYWERDVILCDLNPKVVRAWQYVIRATPDEILALPLIEPGQRVDELDCCDDARLLIGWCVNSAVVRPKVTLTPWGVENLALGNAGSWSAKRRARIANVAAHVKHWLAVQANYADLPNDRATWFIDPPYIDAGRNYPCGSRDIDYRHLSDWCRSRRGQVIVCENEGANWLPFEPFIRDKRGATYDASVSRRRTEMIWTNAPQAQQQGAENMAAESIQERIARIQQAAGVAQAPAPAAPTAATPAVPAAAAPATALSPALAALLRPVEQVTAAARAEPRGLPCPAGAPAVIQDAWPKLSTDGQMRVLTVLEGKGPGGAGCLPCPSIVPESLRETWAGLPLDVQVQFCKAASEQTAVINPPESADPPVLPAAQAPLPTPAAPGVDPVVLPPPAPAEPKRGRGRPRKAAAEPAPAPCAGACAAPQGATLDDVCALLGAILDALKGVS